MIIAVVTKKWTEVQIEKQVCKHSNLNKQTVGCRRAEIDESKGVHYISLPLNDTRVKVLKALFSLL